MARNGPAPKPTALRLLHGDKRSRINLAEPVPRDRDPSRPGWLSPMAAEEWDRIVPDLAAMRVVRESDAMAVAAYCEAVARLRAASALLASGLTVHTVSGRPPARNPAWSMAQHASAEVRLWARELGLTPSARAGIRVTVRAEEPGPGRLLT